MTVPIADSDINGTAIDSSVSWRSHDADCTLVLATPWAEPELWDGFVAGAVRSYRKHGVVQAIEPSTLADPFTTSLFLAAVDDDGRVIGGVRAQGPYRDAEEAHAIVEWAGQPALPAVHKMISDRLPFGVVEIKTAWTDDNGPAGRQRGRELTPILARMPLHATLVLGAKFAMATAADHVLDRWRSSGGVVSTRIPPTPYPDERYRTRIMWWDRAEFSRYADAQQISAIIAESNHLVDLSGAVPA